MNYKISRHFFLRALLFSSACFLPGLASCIYQADSSTPKSASKDDKTSAIKGKVIFDRDNELESGEANSGDVTEIVGRIKQFWDCYLRMDLGGIEELLAPDVTRLSQRTRLVQQGARTVLDGLKNEWEAFERPENLIAEKLTLKWMQLSVNNPDKASDVIVIYWIDIKGGVRWHYDDLGAVLQSFSKQSGSWKLIHHTDVWSLNYNLDEKKPGRNSTFIFDYVYPVVDLGKAVRFYAPLLGQPDAVTENRAFFNLRGSKFILDTSGLQGYAQVRKNLPNGYAIIYVANLSKEKTRLLQKGVTFLADSDQDFVDIDGARGLIIQDQSGNVIAIAGRNYETSSAEKPSINGLQESNPYIAAARAIAWAWLTKDSENILKYHGENSQWLDSSRIETRGPEIGKRKLQKALETVYWTQYESSKAGLSIQMMASNVYVRSLSGFTIVSYLRTFQGNGRHPFRETAFVTHVFKDEQTVMYTLIVEANRSEGLAIELDYTGHPVDDLQAAEAFYKQTLGLGTPYTDKDWRGWWSNNSVYGTYTSDPNSDGIPKKGKTNGYASFWVRSAQQTYDYLKANGANFPVISSINKKQGLDVNPGYTQCVATDVEGNLIVFTEYSGKRR